MAKRGNVTEGGAGSSIAMHCWAFRKQLTASYLLIAGMFVAVHWHEPHWHKPGCLVVTPVAVFIHDAAVR